MSPSSRRTLIYDPQPVLLTEGQIRREPTRPPAHRPPGFDEQFDSQTLLFDCFFRESNVVLVTAPPFFNLRPFLRRMTVLAAPSGQSCSFHIRDLDRHSQIEITVPQGTTRITLYSQIGRFDLEPRQNLCEFFADRRVLFTQSKNNRFEWIQDWIRYHRDIHGANAVLIYDNHSADYSPQELRDALCGLSGIDRICIVSWPFLFGPQGFGFRHYWDSDFCQYGVWEHGRWMFLRHARSVMSADIDELAVSEDGTSVFETAERSRLGAVRYLGHWVHGFEGITAPATDPSPVRFLNFDPYYLRHSIRRRWGIPPWRERNNICPSKWTVVPGRCPRRAQWAPHRIKGWINALPLNRNFSFRHFREISNHWKYDRSGREAFDANRYAFDPRLCLNFAAVQWTS